MTDKVVDIEANLPHFVIPTDDNVVHVIPVSCFRRVVDGSMQIEDIEGWRPIVSKVISEWLEQSTT